LSLGDREIVVDISFKPLDCQREKGKKILVQMQQDMPPGYN